MANIKKALDQQVTRGESLGQIVILVIIILGVTQFTSILAAEPNTAGTTNNTASVGATGKTGATGPAGQAGQDGQPGPTGSNGANGLRGLAGSRGDQGLAGSRGDQGLAGATGIPGSFTAAYGQLTATSQAFYLETPNEWVPIPFDETGPSSHTTLSLSSPATITVQQDGVCQLNVSVYFSAEEADESIFTPTNYRLGVKVNSDAIKPVSAIYANQAGEFLLNYTDIIHLSASDTVRFYMASSDTDMRPFANLVTVENSNAYLMQISE